MVLLSPTVNKAQIRWKEWITGRVLEVKAYWAAARLVIMAAHQHVWSFFKTQHDNRSVILTKTVKQVPQRGTLSYWPETSTRL